MALCEISNRKMRGQNAVRIVFFSASNSGAAGTNSEPLKLFRASKGSDGPDTNISELLILKHDHTY